MAFPHDELLHSARQVFPKALIEEIGNLDDVNSAIDIAIKPFVTIRMKIDQNTSLVVIKKHDGSNRNYTGPRRIFMGQVPSNKEVTEPDFDFMEKVLKNHDCFK